MDLEIHGNGESIADSSFSTPYTSAPSSPGRSSSSASGGSGGGATSLSYYFSAPASPMHFLLSSPPAISNYSAAAAAAGDLDAGNFEFDLSARSMSTADELFLNGQIRPGFLSPSVDQDQRGRNQLLRTGSVHRRTRSVSPTRSPRLVPHQFMDELSKESASIPSQIASGSTSRSSSSSSTSSSSSSNSIRTSNRWTYLKDLLFRSKSEGRDRGGARDHKMIQSASFSPVLYKERIASGAVVPPPAKRRGRPPPAPVTGKAEEMRRRTTFLPYRQGLLFGCLGFNSKMYGSVNGVAKTMSPVSSRRSSIPV